MLTTLSNPLIVMNPRLGVINLLADAGEKLAASDVKAFGSRFSSIDQSSTVPPACDVLFAYLKLEPDGAIANTEASLERFIELAGAPVVVVASENSVASYMKATAVLGASGRRLGATDVNLVMTLRRLDPLFAQFFAALFSSMFDGTTMPVAWERLAPQIPHEAHAAPETIFACGAGHIAFGRRPSLLSRLFRRFSVKSD